MRSRINGVVRLLPGGCSPGSCTASHLDLLFREHATKGWMRGIVAGVMSDKKPIGYPEGGSLRLSGTLGGGQKPIDNAWLVDFIST
jgi:hypothetical protein